MVRNLKIKFNSIKLMATVGILLVGLLTISGFGHFTFKFIRINLENKYFKEAELILEHAADNFCSQFEQVESLIEILSSSQEAKNSMPLKNRDKLVALLTSHEKVMSKSRSVYMGLEDGSTICAEGRWVLPGYDPRKRDWYIQAKNAGDKIISTTPYLDYATQRITITIAKSVYSSDGEMIGVIAVDFESSVISSMITNLTIGEKGFITMVNGDGTIIANKNEHMIGEKFLEGDFNRLVSSGLNKGFYHSLYGEKYFLKFSKLGNIDIFFVCAVSQKEINKHLLQAFYPILIIGGFCLLISGLIVYIGALRVIFHLEKLAHLMRKAEEGVYELSDESSAYYELRSLAKGFNSMIKSIRSRDERLRGQYEELKKSQMALKEREEKIRHLAYFDSLTSLLNRESLMEVLKRAIENAQMHNHTGAIIYIDLDNFKAINDTLGHSIGDKLLIELSKRFKQNSCFDRKTFRIGGDEFIILLGNAASSDTVRDIAQKVLDIFQEPVVIDSKTLGITASVGISLFPQDGRTVEELLKKADMAMYKAKQCGKNCYMIFDESMEKDISQRVAIENGLKKAIKNQEFSLHYQPQYNVRDGRIHGLEALIRWYSPEMGQVSPLKFIKIAEETGLIVSIEKWVLRKAFTFARIINEMREKHIMVSVNISAVHVMQKDFVSNVTAIINETGVSPALLELEITETVMMESFDSNKKKLEALKELGIKIHLDDFGSGYSSLSYLQNLPIDYVKVDKAFIDCMENSERDGRITSTIIELAHNIGLRVVAEGVERKEQYDLLEQFDCDILQGYYMSRPIPEEQVLALLKSEDARP
ncbi:MAG: EAL domain-containing protein [Clostridia bacterium]|nr:EAL domain-containing protein [Clostridia bacterium]